MKLSRPLFVAFLVFSAFGATAATQVLQEANNSQTNGARVVRIGGRSQAAKLAHKVLPVYPPAAKQAGIQGTVTLRALIGKDGRVLQLVYGSGPPALVQSSIDAVRQWEYQPTLLNGKPVEVETRVTVVFSLGTPPETQSESPKHPGHFPARPEHVAPGVIRIGPQVAAAKLVNRVLPVYPAEAKRAGISGTIVLRALIGKDGRVEQLRYVSGPSVLVESAMAAVRRWQYQPTLLHGAPVKVETQIAVIYSLPGHGSQAPQPGSRGKL